jgi:alpha-galactosidase
LVERLHQQGQKVTVWVALFMAGKATRAYQQVRNMLSRDPSGKERIDLCPCHPDTPGYLARTFLKLATDYDLDGFWLDFMDGLHVPCHAPHPHFTSSPGEGYNRCLGAIRDAVMHWKQGFLLETRMKMANINVKQFVNVLETSDMPFDFDLNRSLGVFVRSFAGGLATKLDPAQWHIHESNENVAKSCATVTLIGVPVFGVDFTLLPESHIRVVAAWMDFYRRHQMDLAKGRFAPAGLSGLLPQFRVLNGAKAFVYVGASSTAPTSVDGCEELYIVNASDADRVLLMLDAAPRGRWRAVVRDCFLAETQTREISVSSEKLLLDEAIPQGGLLELHRI